MKFNSLGKTNIKISTIGLGTMTFGEQNSETESFNIMNFAFENGVNFFDTAEMYPIYPRSETYGMSEKIIGKWIKDKKIREKIIIGTKISSKNKFGIGASKLKWIRDGGEKLIFDKKNIYKAVDDSLMRLRTDYIDIYQLHWPERNVGMFGQLDYKHSQSETWTPFEEILENLKSLIKIGKIRYIGVSNETPWGIMKFINLAEKKNLPRIVTNQHCYNLINRIYNTSNSEVSIKEKCGLLAYSPLAGGILSGKYINNATPKNSRYSLWPKKNSKLTSARTETAVMKYIKVAKKYNIKPSVLAHAFVINQPFLTSSIVGSTSSIYLNEAIESLKLKFNNELLNEIEEIHLSDPNPSI